MIRSTLGQTIDIHCGGSDLVFPHHENEIAQSEGAHNHPLSRYWMHNGMVKVAGEKMSKSLGNFTTIRDLLDRPIEPMVIRLFILTAHYRKPMDFTPAALASSENSWQTLQEGLLFGYKFGEKLGWDLQSPPSWTERVSAPSLPAQVLTPPPAVIPLVRPFQHLPENVQKFSREYSGLVGLATVLFFTQFPVRFLARFFDSFNTIPLLPEFFKLVGIAIVARTILFKNPREQFFANWRQAVGRFSRQPSAPSAPPVGEESKTETEQVNPYFQQFCTIVDEDFNFAGGLAILFDLAKDLGKTANILTHGGQISTDAATLQQQWYSLQALAQVLGLEAKLADEQPPADGLSDREIEELLAEREVARTNRNYRESDRIRNDLQAQGVVVVDRKGEPATWYRS
jgi:cysteinyl-tRNA synthetase